MKRKILLSNWCAILTLLVFIILTALIAFAYKFGAETLFVCLCVLVMSICLVSLFYVPMSISADSEGLTVRRALWYKHIPMSEIEDIRICPPTMSEKMICGSAGFMGHWGWFKETDLGKYFAYYGRSSDCFLVRLKNGKKYMLGCMQPRDIVDFVKKEVIKK